MIQETQIEIKICLHLHLQCDLKSFELSTGLPTSQTVEEYRALLICPLNLIQGPSVWLHHLLLFTLRYCISLLHLTLNHNMTFSHNFLSSTLDCQSPEGKDYI